MGRRRQIPESPPHLPLPISITHRANLVTLPIKHRRDVGKIRFSPLQVESFAGVRTASHRASEVTEPEYLTEAQTEVGEEDR